MNMLKVQKKDNKQNRIINDTYSFGLRTHKLHLQLQSDVSTFAAIIVTSRSNKKATQIITPGDSGWSRRLICKGFYSRVIKPK